MLSFAEPYYSSGSRIRVMEPDITPECIVSHINAFAAVETSEEEQLELLAELCCQLYRGRFKNDGTWSADSPEDVYDLQTMAQSLSTEIFNINGALH